jgi:DNA-directed RNA polymerase specialized sigma24 family protein
MSYTDLEDTKTYEEFERVLKRLDLLKDLAYLYNELGPEAVAVVSLRALGFEDKEICKVFGCRWKQLNDLLTEISYAMFRRDNPEVEADMVESG